jgi:hypothetical protein
MNVQGVAVAALVAALWVVGCGGGKKQEMSAQTIGFLRSANFFQAVDAWHRALKPGDHRVLLDSGKQRISLDRWEKEALDCDPSGSSIGPFFGRAWVDLYVDLTTTGHRKHLGGRDFIVATMRIWPATSETYQENVGRTIEVEIAMDEPRLDGVE